MKRLPVFCLLLTSSALSFRIPEEVQQNVLLKSEVPASSLECGASLAFSDGDRIVGGRPAYDGEFPWIVSVEAITWWSDTFDHICGGSLISDQYILTAAHCVYDADSVADVQVVTGAFNLDNPSPRQETHLVSSIILHKEYDPKTYLNDVALIKLSQPVDLGSFDGYVNRVCLPFPGQPLKGYLTVTGWGATSEGGDGSPELMAADVPVIESKSCQKLYGSENILEGMICAGESSGGKDSCQLDSGGPLIRRDSKGRAQLTGIVSWGVGCAQPGHPGVYTNVADYVPWILKNAV